MNDPVLKGRLGNTNFDEVFLAVFLKLIPYISGYHKAR